MGLTAKGAALYAKAQTGIALHFTRIALGDGDLGTNQAINLNALISQKVSLAVTELKVLTGGKAVIGGVMQPSDVTTGFYWKELGLFATDPDLGEVLYYYGNAGAQSDWIPPNGGGTLVEKHINVTPIVGNASSITATIDDSLVYATVQDLQGKISHSLATAVNDFLIASKAGTFVKKTLAEVKSILGLGSAAYTDSAAYATANHNHNGTYETPTGAQDKVNALAGAGNTKTVKQLSDELGSHSNDNTAHVPYAGITTGTVNAYTIATPAITALTAGMAVCVKFHVDSTAASTLNWNGKGAKGIKKANGVDATNLKSGIYTLRYDGANFILQGDGASGDATASDLRSGKKASTDAGDIIGNVPVKGNNPSVGHEPSIASIASGVRYYLKAPKGLYDNDTWIFIDDPNFVENNIKKDVTVHGKTGTLVDGTNMKKTAIGTVSSSSSQLGFLNQSNQTTNFYYLEVSGLTFTPRMICIDRINGAAATVYDSTVLFAAGCTIMLCAGSDYTLQKTGNAYVSSTGFRLPVWYNATYTWWAIE